MEQNAKVIKMKPKNPMYQEDTVLLNNMAQILLAVVKAHGAKTTLTALQGMIQDAQRSVNEERKIKPTNASLPTRNLKTGSAK